MEILRPKTWNGIVRAIESTRRKLTYTVKLENGSLYQRPYSVLFRGQPDACLPLSTTLDRKLNEEAEIDVLQYSRYARTALKEIESYTGRQWDFPTDLEGNIREHQDRFTVYLPAYEYLIYLRHHGFPSPLLDWTESPYIAAYFAYISAEKNPAIYCYSEMPTPKGKHRIGGEPAITVQGPFVRTHKRHFAQKGWYTVATKYEHSADRHVFCLHDDVFSRNDPHQDILVKIVLPIKIRAEALKHLNDYNINHFTLFQTEDALVKTMELKIFDLSNI